MGAAISRSIARRAPPPPPPPTTAQAPQAGAAGDDLVEPAPPPPVVRGRRSRRRAPRGEPAATAAGARASSPPSDVDAAVEDQAPPPARAPPRRRNRRNRREPAGLTAVEEQQLEVDASREGNKRQRVALAHCLSQERREVSSVQSNEEPADEVPPMAAPTLTCPVCWNELEEPSTTNCGHVFCDKCVKQAVRVHKKCPTCRKKLRKNNIHRIYLPTSDS